MLKNHLKMSIRNLWKNKLLSTLNLISLSIGLGGVMTLIFAVYAYYNADAKVKDQEHIYYLKTVTTNGESYTQTTYPLLDKIVESSPEVIAATHWLGWSNFWLKYNNTELEKRTAYVDAEFFQVISLPLEYGNPNTALKNKYSIVLTDKVKKQLFGDKNPMGKTIQANDSTYLTVTGVLKPISPYSTFRLDMLLSTKLLESFPNFKKSADWGNSFTLNYLRVSPTTDIAQLESHISNLVQQNYVNPTRIASIQVKPFTKIRMDFIPVVETIIVGSIAASAFLLLIILVNLLNLNSSTMFRRIKEIAIRKILGSSKKSIILQHCLENGLLVFTSILISGLLFIILLLPKMNDILGPDFGKITFSLKNDYPVILYAIALGIFVTLIVGILPTLRFISLPVSTAVKGKINALKNTFFFRNSFITLQFTIAILFICVAIILNKQIGYMKNAPLGFTKENVIVGKINLEYKDKEAAASNFGTILDNLKASPFVKSFSASEVVPSEYFFNYTSFYNVKTDNNVRMRYARTDAGYLKTFEIPLVAGRDFDKELDNSEEQSVIINRKAMEVLGWTDIEGKRLITKKGDSKSYPVIGIMENFHYQDMQQGVEPLIHFYRNSTSLDYHRFLTVRVVKGHESEVQKTIASSFNNIATRRNYKYDLLSNMVSAQYRLIEGILKIVNVVALLTIFISCLGMFGLISFMAKRRIKEIGIRKVLGAGVLKIMILLSKDYIILVSIAAIIAFPVAWYIMDAWLAGFAYSITIKWWMFMVSGLIALVITAFTVGIQAIKSATVNPVKSLRTE